MSVKVSPVEDGSWVTGVTFDPPLHWKEWESVSPVIEDAVDNGGSSLEDMRDELRSAENRYDDAVRDADEVSNKLEKLLEKMNSTEPPTRETIVKVLEECVFELENIY